MNSKKRKLFAFVIVFAIGFSLYCSFEDILQASDEKPSIVSVIGYGKGPTHQSAYENAIENAIFRRVGTTVSTEYLLANLRLNGSLAGAIPFIEILESNVSNKAKPHSNMDVDGFEEKASISVQTNGYDPSFYVSASMGKPIFVHDQEYTLTIKATKDCTIWVFNLTFGDDLLQQISGVDLLADREYQFPSEKDYEGYHVNIDDPTASIVNEAFYILALKGQEKDIYKMNQEVKSLQVLVKKVMRIPLSQRAETLIHYRIKANGL